MREWSSTERGFWRRCEHGLCTSFAIVDAEGASQTRDRDLGEARRLTAGSGHYLLVSPDPRDTLKGITRSHAAECTTLTHVMRCLHL